MSSNYMGWPVMGLMPPVVAQGHREYREDDLVGMVGKPEAQVPQVRAARSQRVREDGGSRRQTRGRERIRHELGPQNPLESRDAVAVLTHQERLDVPALTVALASAAGGRSW